MIDVSDGLLADLEHVAAASGVSIRVDADTWPDDPVLTAAAGDVGAEALGWRLTGGESHALVATLPADVVRRLAGIGHDARVVGAVLAGSGVATPNLESPARLGGYDHFSGGNP